MIFLHKLYDYAIHVCNAKFYIKFIQIYNMNSLSAFIHFINAMSYRTFNLYFFNQLLWECIFLKFYKLSQYTTSYF